MPYSLLVVFANAKFVKFDIILGESGPQKPKYWSGRLVDCTTGILRGRRDEEHEYVHKAQVH